MDVLLGFFFFSLFIFFFLRIWDTTAYLHGNGKCEAEGIDDSGERGENCRRNAFGKVKKAVIRNPHGEVCHLYGARPIVLRSKKYRCRLEGRFGSGRMRAFYLVVSIS